MKLSIFRFSAFILALMVSSALHAQKKPKFGQIDIEDLKMTVYPQDSSAGAVILMDYGKTTLDHNIEVLFTRHVRIKILNKDAFDWADVSIPYAKGDMVNRLKAATYNLVNGKVEQTMVEKSDMFVEKADKYRNDKNFTFPNVKEGSIIEYTFAVNYGSIKYISPWYFQHKIPVIHSEYHVELPEYYKYRKIMTGYIALEEATTKPKNIHILGQAVNSNSELFIAKHVPAFKDEAYLESPDDYISKISFELDQVVVPGQPVRYYMAKSYKHLSYELADNDIWEKDLNRGKIVESKVGELTAGIEDPVEKMKAIYYWVQDNFEVDVEYYEDNYKKIFEEKKGFAFDINFVLIMMLKEAGFNAEPLRISTRAHGKIHPFYPSLQNFNYLLCLVTHEQKEYFLDPSDKLLPFNTLGAKSLNGEGMVISRENPRMVALQPTMRSLKMLSTKIELDNEGNVQGEMQITRNGYEALDFQQKNKEDLDQYKENFSKALADWTINSHTLQASDKPDAASITETVEMEVEQYAESMGDVIYVSPMLYGGIKENPFKNAERIFPIDYPYPIKEVVSFTITIPEGYVMEEGPSPVAFALPNNGGRFAFSVSANGRNLMITSQLMINKMEFLPEEYPILRQFYAQIVAKQSEQIVLKKAL